MLTPIITQDEISFEPGPRGAGSFWSGDNLLATLTIPSGTGRQGRLSIRQDNRALDLQTATAGQRRVYRLIEAGKSLGSAEWDSGAPSASLTYRGRDYGVTPTGLIAAGGPDAQPLVTFDTSINWAAKQLALRVRQVTDLPLVVFFVFIAHDLASVVSGQNMR